MAGREASAEAWYLRALERLQDLDGGTGREASAEAWYLRDPQLRLWRGRRAVAKLAQKLGICECALVCRRSHGTVCREASAEAWYLRRRPDRQGDALLLRREASAEAWYLRLRLRHAGMGAGARREASAEAWYLREPRYSAQTER